MKKNVKIEKHGEFFAPGYENFKTHGILYIYDDNSIELDLWGTPDDNDDINSSKRNFPVIIGRSIPDNQYIILNNCVSFSCSEFTRGGYRPVPDPSTVAKSQWYVDLVFHGISFEEYQDFKFNEFVFRIENSSYYFYSKPFFDMSIVKEESKIIIESRALTCDDIQVNLTDDIILDISFYKWNSYSIDQSKMTFGLDPVFKLSSKSQKCHDFNYFIKLAQKVRFFLTFCSKRHMNITDFGFLRAQERVNGIIDTYYSNLSYTSDLSEDYDSTLTFDPNTFNDLLVNWMKLYDKLDLILHLLDLVNIGRISWTEERFLVLSRCLEGLHRIFYDEPPVDRVKLKETVRFLLDEMGKRNTDADIQDLIKSKLQHANQMTFQNRILSLLDLVLEQMSPDNLSADEIQQFHGKLARDIKNDRNYYTHVLISENKTKPDLNKLGHTADILLMFMDLHLLKLLTNNNIAEQDLFSNRGLHLKLHRFKEKLQDFALAYYAE